MEISKIRRFAVDNLVCCAIILLRWCYVRDIEIPKGEVVMEGSVYNIIELVGSSKTSWEDAAKNAVEAASKSLEDLRVAEVVRLDVTVENGKVTGYRARLNLSFKYHQKK
jgi:flavin-binding protein dodecin